MHWPSLSTRLTCSIITQADKLDLVIQTAAVVSSLKYVIFFDELSNAKRAEYESKSRLKFISYAQVLTAGTGHPASRTLATVKGDDMAVIMYTSGSTGNPKGVLMTHKNLLAAGWAVTYVPPEPLSHNDTYIAFLPLAHVLELAAETVHLGIGARIGYGSPLTLNDNGAKNAEGKPAGDLSVLRPTIMAAVPLILDRLKAAVTEQVNKSNIVARTVFNIAFYLKQRNWMRKQSSPILDRLVFSKIAAKMGGRVRYLLSGGAPLSKDTQAFINVVFCVPVLQGYGLTETLAANCICLTGDHRVLSRTGWRPIASVKKGDEVLSFNMRDTNAGKVDKRGNKLAPVYTSTYEQEWKAVTDVTTRDVDPSKAADTLYRIQGSGMDVIATRDHRMLLAHLLKGSANGLATRRQVDYETVAELLPPNQTYEKSTLSANTKFAHSQVRAVIRGGNNTQPAVKLVIPGLEQVCDWWWQRDGQLALLQLIGFWLGDGHLNLFAGTVQIAQKKEQGKQWLTQLLNTVFPGWWRWDINSADDKKYCYTVRCPPLYNYLRVMAVGPLGYNPRDPVEVHNYPEFAFDRTLAAKEQQSDYYKPNTSRRWKEAEMLAAMQRAAASAASPASTTRPRLSTESDDDISAESDNDMDCTEPTAVDSDGDSDSDEPGDEQDRPHGEAVVAVTEQQAQLVASAVTGAAAGAVIVWWNNGLWTIIRGHWFYLKRWLGEQNVANVYSKLSRQQAVALLDGFCRADGTWASVQYAKDKDGQDKTEPAGLWECSNSSMPLIDNLMLIGQLAGAAVTLSRVNKGGDARAIDGRTVAFTTDHWRVRFSFQKSARGIPFPTAPLAGPVDVSDDVEARGNFDHYQDNGKVYCITVDGNSNFLTQRLSYKPGQQNNTVLVAHPMYIGNCHPDDVQPNNVGAPIPSCEIKLVDVPEMGYHSTDKDKDGNPAPRGEIVIRGGCVAPGYFDMPTQTAEVFEKGKGKASTSIRPLHTATTCCM